MKKILFCLVLCFMCVFIFGYQSQLKPETEKLFREALSLKGQPELARLACLDLLKDYKNEIIYYNQGKETTIGLAALEMLGFIAISQGEIDKALEYFEKMGKLYPDGYTFDSGSGRQGPSKPHSLYYRACVLSGYDYYKRGPNEKEFPEDYKKAIDLSYQLINEFRDIECSCDECSATYGELAANIIIFCVEKMGLSLEAQEKEIRKILSLIKKGEFSAGILLNMGNKYKKAEKVENAINIYKEIISDYPNTCQESDLTGEYNYFAMDAFIGILDLKKDEYIKDGKPASEFTRNTLNMLQKSLEHRRVPGDYFVEKMNFINRKYFSANENSSIFEKIVSNNKDLLEKQYTDIMKYFQNNEYPLGIYNFSTRTIESFVVDLNSENGAPLQDVVIPYYTINTDSVNQRVNYIACMRLIKNWKIQRNINLATLDKLATEIYVYTKTEIKTGKKYLWVFWSVGNTDNRAYYKCLSADDDTSERNGTAIILPPEIMFYMFNEKILTFVECNMYNQSNRYECKILRLPNDKRKLYIDKIKYADFEKVLINRFNGNTCTITIENGAIKKNILWF